MCREFIIYPGNRLNTTITATNVDAAGEETPLDLSIYDTINIHFKKTVNSDPIIELSTATGEGLTINENQIVIDKEIDASIDTYGPVIFDIEAINDDGAVTFGPGEAFIVKKITNPTPTT